MTVHFPKVLVNHVGFRPGAAKYALVASEYKPGSFLVTNTDQKGFEPSFTGEFVAAGDDLGEYSVGDFSDLAQPGTYRIAASGNYHAKGKLLSHEFTIADNVWDDPIGRLVNYYRVQSCGDSECGYNSPCHTGPIRRDDGGEAVPITGGWHAAHDHQRNVREILHGAFGLIYLALARPDVEDDFNLFHEIQWGNDYFLAIQDPEGYLYAGVAAANYGQWEEFDWWASESHLLVTEPAPLFHQYCFVAIQALIADRYSKIAPEYAPRCLGAATRCFEYIQGHDREEWQEGQLSYELGTGILAGVHMFRATGDEQYRAFAREMANQLLSLQAPDGYWLENPGAPDPNLWSVGRMYAPYVVIGLCAAAQWFSDDPDHSRWMAALEQFASHYVEHFSEANAFGIMPYRVDSDRPAQRGREWQEQYYRYFMQTDDPATMSLDSDIELGGNAGFAWQTGNNARVAGYGVAMVYLAELLSSPELRKLAQRQLDWVLGVNPFDASMIIGVGRNQPPSLLSNEIVPGVPDIEGAVMQGPIGNADDNPLIVGGHYAPCEFWMPHHAWVLWLMAELSADQTGGP